MIPEVGSIAPDFALADDTGDERRLSDIAAAAKHVVLVFYRGHW